MPADMVSMAQAEKIRLRNLPEHIKDEHRAKFCNHVCMILLSSFMVGIVTGWEATDLLIQGSISLPTLVMELFDYLAKL